MAQQKTSLAQIITCRMNPIHPEQKRALEIIDAKRAAGYSLVDILCSALIRASGQDPVTFNHERHFEDERLAVLVAKAVKEALADVKLKPDVFQHDESNGKLTDYAKNFGQGFAARMRHSKGEE